MHIKISSSEDPKYPWERGGGEKKEKGWPVFGDEGPEAFISLSIKQHTLALIMARALRALRVI